MDTETIQTVNTIEELRAVCGSRKVIQKVSVNGLLRLRDEAKLNKSIANECRHNETDPARRMHLNGAIAAKDSIINRIDQLLKEKNYKRTGLGVNL
jgi:hypothetical protein